MKKITLGLWLGCVAATTAGCGANLEYLINTAKSSAMEEIDARVDELVSEIAADVLDEDQLGDWLPEDEEDE